MLRKALAQGKVGVGPLAAINKTEDEMKVPKLKMQTPSVPGIAEKTASHQQERRESSAASMNHSNADGVPSNYLHLPNNEYETITDNGSDKARTAAVNGNAEASKLRSKIYEIDDSS